MERIELPPADLLVEAGHSCVVHGWTEGQVRDYAERCVETAMGDALKSPPSWWHCSTHGSGNDTAWGCPECVREMRAEIKSLRARATCGCGDQFTAHDPGTCGACVAALGELRRDAERWKWLRQQGGWPDTEMAMSGATPEEFDVLADRGLHVPDC